VQGSVTGESLDLGVIDDPIKGRESANSATIRQKTWEWLTDDFFTRFSENAGFLMILTRWHIDDPAQRLKDNLNIETLKYKAIAEVDEEHRKTGEALIPEHKSIDFLLERKRLMGLDNFEALYQQNPVVSGGNLLKQSWIRWYKVAPRFAYKIITVDTAQKTKEINDYTVMQCWGVTQDKDIYLIDMVRDKLEAPDLRRQAKLFYNKHQGHPPLRKMYIEDKSSGSSLIQDLKRVKLNIGAVQRNIDKVSRANDTAPFIEAGRVYLNEDIPYIQDLLTEYTSFPNGVHDDTLDPLFDAVDIVMIQGVSILASVI